MTKTICCILALLICSAQAPTVPWPTAAPCPASPGPKIQMAFASSTGQFTSATCVAVGLGVKFTSNPTVMSFPRMLLEIVPMTPGELATNYHLKNTPAVNSLVMFFYTGTLLGSTFSDVAVPQGPDQKAITINWPADSTPQPGDVLKVVYWTLD